MRIFFLLDKIFSIGDIQSVEMSETRIFILFEVVVFIDPTTLFMFEQNLFRVVHARSV